MSFWKRNGKTLLAVVLGGLMLTQQLFLHYRLSTRDADKEHQLDLIATDEIDRLADLWDEGEIDQILKPGTLSNTKALEEARLRLIQTEKNIAERERAKKGIACEKVDDLYLKACCYYRHSLLTFLDVVNFLITKSGRYRIVESDFIFSSREDEKEFQKLVKQIAHVYEEKDQLDALIQIYKK